MSSARIRPEVTRVHKSWSLPLLPTVSDHQMPATVLWVDDEQAMLGLIGLTLDAADGLIAET